MPESLNPPNGCRPTIAPVQFLFKYRLPTNTSRRARSRFTGLREKPIESWYVNAGIYVIEPAALDHMPDGRFDLPDLIAKLDRVNAYPLADAWFDCGKFEDLGRAAAMEQS